MHLHVLGICGTFMGGLAAIARAAGHTVTGCDANVYPPMSTQLTALGIELTEGWDAAQLRGVARDADVFVIGNVVSRGNPLMEAILDAGRPYVSRTAMAVRERARAALGDRGRRHARQDHDHRDARVDPRVRGTGAGLPDRRRAARLPGVRAPDRQRVLRDRGRRVRHRVLRQALEVRPLPAAHRDPQQPRVRPRRHLSGSRGDRDAIPSPACAWCRRTAASSSTAATPRWRACSRAAAWSEVERFGFAEVPGTGPDWTIAMDGAILLGGAPQGTLAFGQLGRHNQLNALAALAAARHVGVPVAHGLAALARFSGVRRRLRNARRRSRGITVYDDFAHHPTAIAASLEALRRNVGHVAHPRRARAALQHDEARRDEGGAAGEPRARRSRVLLRRQPRLGRGRRARAAWAPRPPCSRSSPRSSKRSRPRRAPAITCS